ncbi:MAG: nitrous oxide-stimulated promoter family protein [Bacteroidales bacterium]|nr:nitrous oxide-stimulated promoter family protein [Bacteroidales bacterium]
MQESKRTIREKRTVRKMMLIYCHHHHQTTGEIICPDCNDLLNYANQRIEKCPFSPDKPTCKNCTVHCYAPKKQEAIKNVMRFSGPRMMWHAPWLVIRHLLDGRKDEERIEVYLKRKKTNI